ncbi:uncharacterized protein LOC142336333 isoform X2 [Convolutriloba macropyga]|uniref:uncharacterized protein LOC142336333 isoform X2 n=1 Tax=Convolutriloba macropyga TaxID=536237 RepID=UPI003F51E65D
MRVYVIANFQLHNGPAVPAADLLRKTSGANWELMTNQNNNNFENNFSNNAPPFVDNFTAYNHTNHNNNNTIGDFSSGFGGVPDLPKRPTRNFTLSLTKEESAAETTSFPDPFSPYTVSAGLKEKRRRFRRESSTVIKSSTNNITPSLVKSPTLTTMSPNPTNYTTTETSPKSTNQNARLSNGGPPNKPIRNGSAIQASDSANSSVGSIPIGVPAVPPRDGGSTDPIIEMSRVEMTTTIAPGDRSSSETRLRHVNGVLKSGGRYSAVECENNATDPESQKSSSIKCKPSVNCFKLRKYQKENSQNLSQNEQSMFLTAIAQLEQVQPRSRLANCELVFFGPDPEGYNPVFYSGSRRNKYLCVWQEDRQSAEFIVRQEPTNYMSRNFVIFYLVIVAFLFLLAYQYWLTKHIIEYTIEKFVSQPMKFEMLSSSSLTLRAKILGPQ